MGWCSWGIDVAEAVDVDRPGYLFLFSSWLVCLAFSYLISHTLNINLTLLSFRTSETLDASPLPHTR